MDRSIEYDKKLRQELNELLSQRILVTDGATGTALEAQNPTAADFGGEEFIGCNETLNLHAPHIVESIHKAYIDAGADIIETNSFNGSAIVLDEYGIGKKSREIARLSAEIANKAIKKYANGRRIFVMGSMGPGTKSLTVTGGATFDEIKKTYYEYSAGLIEGGADILLLETQQDTLNLKAEIIGIKSAMADLKRDLPLAISVTIELNGTMLAGQNIEALYHTLSGYNIFSIGLNCATGPRQMIEHIRALSSLSHFPVTIWPNAGLPDENGIYSETPESLSETIVSFATKGYLNIVGGCCGTTPDHIHALKEAVKGIEPRKPRTYGHFPALAGNEAMVVEKDNRPVFIGERTNSIGSRKFKRLVAEKKYSEAAEIGRLQAQKGAMVLDLCTADPDQDELTGFEGVLHSLQRKVRVPVFIDTTDYEVVEASLKQIGGKPAINSVNLEDGGERLRKVAALAKENSASLVCGLIDDDPEQGMAITVERKLEIAEKIYAILKVEFNIPDEDIIFDPLVFPAGTGDANYLGAAKKTIDGTRAIKEKYPNCLTVLGISNVSFGLPNAGREVVNSVFLYECTKAGLDMAIVNTQKLRRYPTIPENEVKLAENVLYKGDSESITEFTEHFRGVTSQESEEDWDNYSIHDKIKYAIIEARQTGLIDNLDELLKDQLPLDIINGPLMDGMDEVGRLFGDNQLIVAEVLESAEVMKIAVDHLKKFFESDVVDTKGKMILATVKGDVHDIGKNLVDMILSNNGFHIENLGIKIPSDQIIEAVKEHNPDVIGLSGLLVRSAKQMVNTASDLSEAGIDLPLIVGGAALSRKFALTKIAPEYKGTVFYASDPMEGLAICNKLMDKNTRENVLREWKEKSKNLLAAEDKNESEKKDEELLIKTTEWIKTDVPEPPDTELHIKTDLPCDEIFELLNPLMLYGKHLGIKGTGQKLRDGNDPKLNKLIKQVRAVYEDIKSKGYLKPKSVYQWMHAEPGEESISVTNPITGKNEKFSFPRQRRGRQLCAADWIRPSAEGGDYLCLFVTTAGENLQEYSRELKDSGKLLDSHIVQALAIEFAEAAAEWVHTKIRHLWNYGEKIPLSRDDLFNTKYQGIRLSFGYPACPRIEDQEGLWNLLNPEQIGVKLTDGFMMYPESSVSALVFHHAEGKYYAS